MQTDKSENTRAMRIKLYCVYILAVFLLNSGSSQQNGEIYLKSPDGNLIFTFMIDQGYPSYSVTYKGKTMIENSGLSIVFKESGEFGRNVTVSSPAYRTIDEAYDLIVGKTKTARNFCNEVSLPLIEKQSPNRKILLVIRAFNDGIAFRYEFPRQVRWGSFLLTSENSSFKLYGNPEVLTLFRPNFTTSHEGLYTHLPFNEIKADTLMDIPALFDFGGIYMAITEAELVDYAGMYLTKRNGVLMSKLSPLPGQQEICVKATLPHRSPWRVIMISARIGDLFESNILTNLNEPCKIEDISWI